MLTKILAKKKFLEHYANKSKKIGFFQSSFWLFKNGQKKCPKSKNLFPIWISKV